MGAFPLPAQTRSGNFCLTTGRFGHPTQAFAEHLIEVWIPGLPVRQAISLPALAFPPTHFVHPPGSWMLHAALDSTVTSSIGSSGEAVAVGFTE